MLANAETFQKRVAKTIASNKFNTDFVINTDRTGYEYRAHVLRTLSNQGEKATKLFLGDFNKVMHTYTTQYPITASGRLLPEVFLCTQEPQGFFGTLVAAKVIILSEEFENVFVSASKSGKLTKHRFDVYVEKVLKPYCNGNDFMLILDSWGGQTDTASLKSKFTDDDGYCSPSVEIPPLCTPFCQPCDLILFRQVKIFKGKI